MNIKFFLYPSFLLLPVISAYGWGQKGHDTVAFIAENHLSETTKQTIDSLLQGKSIVYYANWLDNASHTPEYSYSKTWHYKNIDKGQSFENAPILETGDIVSAINEQVDLLKSDSATPDEKQLALKMVVHFLGDIHQPMHLGHASDLGGNRHYVKYFGKDSNLHSVWDSSLPESAHKWSYSEWQQQIDRANNEEIIDILKLSTPTEWAKETYEIAKQVYALTPEGTKISYDYVADWTPIIETQFLKGGIRLAALLNSIFDPNSSDAIISF